MRCSVVQIYIDNVSHHPLNRKKQCENSVFIHVQLSVSLFLLHISFLCSVWFSGQGDTESVCQALGLLLHWCLLATFTWTAIEGFNLYLLLVRVFNIYIKRYLLKLSLVGWGEFKFTFWSQYTPFPHYSSALQFPQRIGRNHGIQS